MKKIALYLIFISASLHAEGNTLHTVGDIIKHFLAFDESAKEFLISKAESRNKKFSQEFIDSEISVTSKDINNDGKVDYYLEIQSYHCGSGRASDNCTGVLYISIKSGYCYAGDITPNDFEKPDKDSLTCKDKSTYYDFVRY